MDDEPRQDFVPYCSAPSAAMLRIAVRRQGARMGHVRISRDRGLPGSKRAVCARPGRPSVAGVAILAVALLSVASCAQPTSPAGSNDGGVAIASSAPPSNAPIDVALIDSKVRTARCQLAPFVDSAPAGDVTFRVKNLGTIEHEMIVLKTDTPFDQLPVTDAGDPPAPVSPPAPTRSTKPTTSARPATPTSNPARPGPSPSTLTPGKYVLVCNLAGHYQMGMRAPFTVTRAAAEARARARPDRLRPAPCRATLSDTQGVQRPDDASRPSPTSAPPVTSPSPSRTPAPSSTR